MVWGGGAQPIRLSLPPLPHQHKLLSTATRASPRTKAQLDNLGSMADDESSELSSLSSLSPVPSEDESDVQLGSPAGKGSITSYFRKVPKDAAMPAHAKTKTPPPPPPKRQPSPPHEYVLADNQDIAVRVLALSSRRISCVD